MDNLNKIIKKHLNNILKENNGGNYMFFSNIEQIKRQCELLLNLDKEIIENLLNNGHDWADDHITVAKENLDQVFDFIMNETNNNSLNEDCWKGYEKIGGKLKNGKMVPNCVPKNTNETIKLQENNKVVNCRDCDWSWKISEGGDEPYICHKCGCDNSKKI